MMTIKKYILTSLLVLVCLASARAQDVISNSYLFNPVGINPAAFRNPEHTSVYAGARLQWVGLPMSPKIYELSALSSINNDNIGVGVNFYNETAGPIATNMISALYSYRLWVNRYNLISFGVEVGAIMEGINLGNDFFLPDNMANDPAFIGLLNNKTSPDVSLGVFYKTDDYYIGISAKHLFSIKTAANSFENGETFYTRSYRHYYLGGGGFIFLDYSKEFRLHPSMLVRYDGLNLNVDVNCSLAIRDFVSVGATFKTLSGVAGVFAEYKFLGYFSVFYSAAMNFNKLIGSNYGSHEIGLRFDADLFRNPTNYSKKRQYYF